MTDPKNIYNFPWRGRLYKDGRVDWYAYDPEFGRPGSTPITEQKFWSATGRMPQDDDLDRCNCPEAGQIGHWSCGWSFTFNKPQFDVGPRPIGKEWLPPTAFGEG